MKSRLLILLAALPLTTLAGAPYVDPADDETYFGDPNEILFWTPEQQVAGYRNSKKLAPTRLIPKSDNPYPLTSAPRDFSDLQVTLGDREVTLDEYLEDQGVAGLIVVKNDEVLLENYRLGNTPETKWISFSVAKSLVAVLYGAAVRDGFVVSVDDKVSDYVPRLNGTSYADSSIRNVLQMASGVAWNEDYEDEESDVASADYTSLGIVNYLGNLPRAHAPGESFNYNTGETNLAGIVLRSAIGNNLATYTYEKIWQPFGMEHDAYWNLTERNGGEFGGCCLNASLRDYARLGIFAMNGGKLRDGTPVLADNWMADSTTPSNAYEGYGYFWWLWGNGAYAALGIFGQAIYINPEHGLVIATHGARDVASGEQASKDRAALFAALEAAVTE